MPACVNVGEPRRPHAQLTRFADNDSSAPALSGPEVVVDLEARLRNAVQRASANRYGCREGDEEESVSSSSAHSASH